MSFREPAPMFAVFGAACVALASAVSAQNLSLGQPYAYFITVPGQPPNHYQDDGPINGPHVVHSTGLGAYGLGNLTDGATSASAGGGPGTTHLALWAPCCGNAPPADIIIDLGTVGIVSDLVIGTVISAGLNNNAPDDVTVSYSIAGVAYTGATFYDLEAMYGPLTNGHHDMPLKLGTPTAARFVKFSFDGGSMAEPSGQDPDEKWMLDEITINGVGTNCTASSSNYGQGLTGQLGVPTLRVNAAPRFNTNINVLAGNSSGSATAGLLLVGVQPSSVPFLGGVLLINPILQLSVGVPAGGLALPVTVPGPPCTVPICLQVLQLDAAAVSGVSMTPGLRLDLGT